MPRARSTKKIRQTAAPQYEEQGSGCLSGFTIVPLAVIIISAALASLAWKTNPIVSNQPPVVVSTVAVLSVDVPPNSTSTGISPIFREEVRYWADSIVEWAAASSLNPNLVATIMQI